MQKQTKLHSIVSITVILAFLYPTASVIPVDLTFLTSLPSKIAAAFADKPKPEKVELKDERTENSKTYLNPNGTYTTEISQQPINYEDDGQLKPIDTSLAKDTDGYKVDKNSLQVDFDNKATGLLQITNSEDNTSINYKVSDSDKAQITPIKKSDNELSYDNYKDGASLNYQVQQGRLKEEIVLDKPPADNTFTFELDLKGLKPKEQKDGSIFLLDPKKNNKEINPKERNKPSFIIEAPFMSDSAPQDQNNPSSNISGDVKMEIKQQKNDSIYESSIYTLKVVADKKWLEDPKRVYPVKIDPTFSIQQNSTLDTYLDSDLNKQYPRASEEVMFAGSNSGWGEHRSLVRFDTSFIPKDAAISSAKLYLRQADNSPYAPWNSALPTDTSTTIYRITSDWNKNITWDSMANNYATPNIGNPQTNNIKGMEFDVTGMVRSWQQDYFKNYGFMLLATPGYFINFYTSEANIGDQYKPRLAVTYTLNRVGRESYRTYKDFSGVSVDLQTGNAIVEATDVNIAGRGPAAYVSHIYNSQDTSSVQKGQGFSLSTNLLRANFNSSSTAVVTTETGARHTYTLNADGTTFTRPSGVDDDLFAFGGGLYLKRKDGSKITFAGDGRLSKEIDKNGNELIYDYDTPNVITIKDSLNRATKLFYNVDGNISKIVDFAGRITSFSYTWYINGYTSSAVITNPSGERTIYAYDNGGRLITIKNSANESTNIAYDNENKVTSITNPLGKTMSFNYTLENVEASRNLLVNSSFEDGLNRWNYFGSLSYAVNPSANPDATLGNNYLHTNTANPGDSWYQDYSVADGNTLNVGDTYTFSVYVRSPTGTPITVNLTLWNLYNVNYTSKTFTIGSNEWQRVAVTHAIAPAGNNTLRAQIHLQTANTDFQFDGAQLEKNAFASSFSDNYIAPKPREVSFTTATDPKGSKFTYYFNSEGLLTKMGEPIGSTTTTAANEPYFPDYTITVPAPGGGTQDIGLDDFAEDEFIDFETDVEADMADSGEDAVDIITIPFQQGAVPKPEVSQPLAEGTVTQYQYDEQFNIKTIIEKDNSFTTFEYRNGNKIEEKEHDHDYPETSSASTDAAKHRTTTYNYDANNNLASQTSSTGKTTSYTYDAKGNLLTESSPASSGNGQLTTSYTYDQYGNQLTKTDPEGNKTLTPNDYTTTNTYDANNNLVQTTDATGVSTYYTYDEIGNKIAERKENQDITGFSYDTSGRLLSQKSAANTKGFAINRFEYDSGGNKAKDSTSVIDVDTDQTLAWFNSAWKKRVSISIDNTNNSQSLTDYQVKVVVPYTTGMRSDFSDLRFTTEDKLTQIPYWIESKAETAQAIIWLKVPTVAASSSKTIYMYFDNAAAISESNGTAVFEAYNFGSPTSFYKLDESAGQIAIDSVRLNNGVLRSDAYWTAGKKGNGVVTFSNGYVDVGSIDIGNEWSIETWFIAPIAQPVGGWATFTRGSNDHQIIAYEGRDLGTFDNATGTNFHDSGFDMTSLSAGWHHLVAVGTAAGTTDFYIDGVLRGTSNFRSTTDIVAIGNYQGGGQPFGTFDEVGIYNRALSSSEISSLANNQLQKMGSVHNLRKISPVEPIVNIGTLKKYTKYVYNADNQLTLQANYSPGNELLAQTEYEYNDANGNKTAEKKLMNYDAANNPIYSTTTYEYDELNRLIKEVRPDGSFSAYKYDSMGNVVAEGSPEGTTANIYDKAKNQIATASSDKTVTKSIYDKEGNERIIGDGKSIASATNYDANGNIEKVADAANKKTDYAYDANQNEKTVTSPNANVLGGNVTTTTDYNQANQVITETDQNSLSTNTDYDSTGRESSLVQPNNKDQNMAYTYNGSTSEVAALNNTDGSADIKTTYDSLGNTKTITTDEAGTSTQQLSKVDTTYDAADRVKKTTDAQNVDINYGYDFLNNLTGITDLAGTTIYNYDTTNKLKSVTDPNQKTTYFNYQQSTLSNGTPYEKGNVANIALPNGVQSSFSYDEGSKITQLSNTKDTSTLSKYNYTYDANGNITNTVEPDGSTIHSYDSLNRLTMTVNKDASIINYTYDEQGNRLKKEKQVVQNSILTTTETLSYSYSPANELMQVTKVPSPLAGEGQGEGVTTYTYDANGNTLNKLELSNNSLLATNYAYDNKNQLVKVKKIYPDSDSTPDNWTPIIMSAGDGRSADYALEGTYSLKFAGDTTKQKHIKQDINLNGNAGDVLTLSGSNKTIDASATGGMIAAGIYLTNADGTQSSSLMYFNKDSHDWTQKTITFTAPKNYTSARVIIFYFKQTGIGYFDDFKLSKSNGNQLLKQPSFELDSDTIEYVYDGNGNRYSKTVNGQTRYYSYDTSGNIVSEYKRVMVNGVEKSQTLVRYVRDNTGKAISMIQEANTYYFIYNGHGDVTALTDSTGTVVATYSYDEFGNQLSVNGQPSTVNEQGIYNPLRYSGAHNAYYDSETNLYKMGTRYYQSDVGRWLTRDSLKGDPKEPQSKNRYVYVDNNPVTYFDSTGYKKQACKYTTVHGTYGNWTTPEQRMHYVLIGGATLIISGGALGLAYFSPALGTWATGSLTTGYRYVDKFEAALIRSTGKIPNVNNLRNPKLIHYSNQAVKSASKAQRLFVLDKKPQYRIEFDLTKVRPGYGGLTRGGGAEFTTSQQIGNIKKIRKLWP